MSLIKAKEIGCVGIGKGFHVKKSTLHELFTYTATSLKDYNQFVKEVNREQKINGFLSLHEIVALMLLYSSKNDNKTKIQEIELV